MKLKGKDFCLECRKETEYFLTKRGIAEKINGRYYTFFITTAICSECGAEMSPPGFIDKNIKEVDEQYKAAEGFVPNIV